MKYYLITYGCQMNKNDSERIAGLLFDLGFSEAAEAGDADLIIMNTCSVRQSAEDRVYGMMKNFAAMKKERSNLVIVVTGCMAGRDKDGKIRARMPGVDIFLPTERIAELPEILAMYFSPPSEGGARGGLSEKIPLNPSHPALARIASQKGEAGHSPFQKGRAGEGFYDLIPKYSSSSQAFVTIQTGCEEYCTYCVVPYARGKIKNRPLKDILDEAKKLAAAGCVEITLLGQIVNAWEAPSLLSSPLEGEAGRGLDFAGLLHEINKIPGIRRRNFMSAHPRYMTDEIIEAMKLPAHVNFLHLPVQSGSNKILQKMNRRYTAEEYLEMIKKIRAAHAERGHRDAQRPATEIALATDIIVGFPGETEEDFEQTVELYKKCDFDLAYLAQYSPRSGTPAYQALKDDVSHEEKERRWRVLQNLMEETVLRKNQKYLGQVVEVLVESCEGGKCTGNSREMKRVVFPGDESLIGQIVNVKISEAKEWELEGDTV